MYDALNGPLNGFTIVDASNFVLGPAATQMLGDMGATVIKVEPLAGDPTRQIGASSEGQMGSFFRNLNRNKMSVALDLKSSQGLKAMKLLLGRADVFVHNMRPKAAKRLGISYDDLKVEFPGLVYASATGFGRGGCYEDRPAFDDVVQALSGVVDLNHKKSGAPAYIPMLFADKLCSVYLANWIQAALLQKSRIGQGLEVQLPMFETMVAFNMLEHFSDAVDGSDEAIGYPRVLKKVHRPLSTLDGAICVVSNTDQQWKIVFSLIGRPELAQDPRFTSISARMKNVEALYSILETELKKAPTAQWMQSFAQNDIPVAPISKLEDLSLDPHLKDVDLFRNTEDQNGQMFRYVRSPITFFPYNSENANSPPCLGEHTKEVLEDLGFSENFE